MIDGWISLHRKIMDNPLYFSEPFTRMQAWIDLLLLANHKRGEFYIRGNKVVVQRGQVGYSNVKLSKRWKWSRGKVIRFLRELETVQQIVQQKSKLITLISVVNYDEYQNALQQTVQQTVQQTDTNNNNNNDNNCVSYSVRGETVKKCVFVAPTIDQIEKEIFEKKYRHIDPKLFIAHYESNGWRVGKNQMKDWRAALSKWEIRDQYQNNGRHKKMAEQANDRWK